MHIDTATEFGARAARRLHEDQMGWLVTVRADGMPQPTPIWFLWEDDEFMIFSEPDAQKVRNIANNPKVSLHLDGDGRGGDIVVVSGEARVVTEPPSAAQMNAYVAKYAEGIKGLGMTPEQLAQTYSTTIRMTPGKLTGH